jgi:uncharacterized protein YbbC (DUF1343 family)
VNRNALDAPALGIELAAALRQLYPQHYKLDKMPELLANDAVFRAIAQGEDPRRIADEWRDSVRDFEQLRKQYLLY